MSERKRTARGFAIYDEFADTYGIEVTVIQSSAVDPACWIYVHDERHAVQHLGDTLYPAVHLSPPMAARLIVALGQFLQDYSEQVEADIEAADDADDE